MSELLFTKISRVRRKHSLVQMLQGVAAALAVLVLLLAAGMLLDWFFELPQWLRAMLLAADVAAIAYVLLWHVVRPVFFGPDDEDIALLVERHMPQFRTSLIASVQLSRPGAIPPGCSRAIVRAMIARTERMAEPLDFAGVIRLDAMLRTQALAALIVLLGMAVFVAGGNTAAELLKRAFLSDVPVPRNTRITCLTLNRTIAIGDGITLEAVAEGVVPRSGTVDLRYQSGRHQQFSMEPVNGAATRPATVPADSGRFARTIDNVQESFSYRIRLNDAQTRWYRITALPRPAVVAIRFTQEYPAYTRRPAEQRSPGDLSLLAGSTLRVDVKASKPLRAAVVRLVGLEQDKPMTVGTDKTQAWAVVNIPARGLSGLSLRMMDEDGITSRAETVYPIDIVLDKEPTVRITWPDRKEELVTRQARVLVGFEATDDFGVDKIFLRHKYDTEELSAARSIELEPGSEPDRRRIRKAYEFDLGALKPMPSEGSVIEYWIEVHDANNVTGPGKASSEHYRAKVVSEMDKRADLMNRLNDHLGTVEYVTQDQEKLSQQLGGLILEKK